MSVPNPTRSRSIVDNCLGFPRSTINPTPPLSPTVGESYLRVNHAVVPSASAANAARLSRSFPSTPSGCPSSLSSPSGSYERTSSIGSTAVSPESNSSTKGTAPVSRMDSPTATSCSSTTGSPTTCCHPNHAMPAVKATAKATAIRRPVKRRNPTRCRRRSESCSVDLVETVVMAVVAVVAAVRRRSPTLDDEAPGTGDR